MKRLNELFNNINSDCSVNGIKINSKEVKEGDIFVCTMGVTTDRHDFIDEAISNGACAVVVSKDVGVKSVPIIKVADTNSYLRELCSKYYDYPYEKMEMIGVTGTNGKTTVAEIIYQLLGDDCAYLGTNGRKWKNNSLPMRNTTPDVDRLYMYLNEFVNDKCKTTVMEASSEAFFRHRLDDIKFHIAILTNISEDHLNIHKTLDNYIECKCQLFRQVSDNGYSILNSMDVNYERVLHCSKGTILTYGMNESDTLFIKDYKEQDNKMKITFRYNLKDYTVLSPLLGEFNVFNLAPAILTCLAKGISIEEVLKRVESLYQIEGRLEILPFTNKYIIMLDYAHTTDALDKILTYLNKIKKNRIITVTGSAGGREKEKRPGMGKVVLEKSDYVIFTMDDPREEDVNSIIDDLISDSKLTNYERVIDRKEAIYRALSIAEEDDIVFITGKGRDNYMAIGKEYLPYSDYDVIKEYFN
ncbi:UDP-N-acetylmuramoyl-L-alanyl-D-glutamate--2,6-diaminopimelate ligase [bacterium]|nr:UDP-N-acetylmuramoyl-L-alanyl-D-glutamate--2,6-diaminopimelate ligase [bacterium]